ncbi:PKD domain-containing protein [Algoriphagus aquatilis]|uniref:PKD domain-containing protein n=1 Tax=Algoriphagus aquatilis TaxID=490186 RepID=A0ABW0BZT6_9BACT
MGLLTKLRILILFTGSYLLWGAQDGYAQKCPQANISITKYELKKLDGSNFTATDPFVVGQTVVTGRIFVELGGSTTSAYNIAMVYDIFVNGVRVVNQQQSCLFDNLTGQTSIILNQSIPVTTFSWTWGDVVSIRNIFFTWENGQGKAGTTCQTLTPSIINGINSQCYYSGPGFTAIIPLFPRFTATVPCSGTTVSFLNGTSGGAAPYTYSWNFAGLGTTNATHPSFTFPQPGSYLVSLTATDNTTPDKLTTTVSQTIVVPPPISIIPSITPTQVNGATGSINVTASGGTSPYTYLWTYPNGSTSSSEDISSLTKGSYSLLVTDARGCTQTATFTVNELLTPDFSFASFQCNTRIDFTNLTAGGTPPFAYTYAWDFTGDGVSDSNLRDPRYDFPGVGTFPVRLTVSDGTTSISVTKNVSVAPNFDIQVTIVPTRSGETTGSIFVTSITGGTSPYSFSWTGQNFASSDRDIFDLPSGLYRLVVTDANGCRQTVDYFLDVASILNLKWKNFDTREVGQKVAIHWEMNTEFEGGVYCIERSLGDVSRFSSIGEIKSQQNSLAPVSYSYTDESYPIFEDLIYYRITYSLGQEITYSPIQLVKRSTTPDYSQQWVAYPNPSHGEVVSIKYLKGNLAEGAKINLRAYRGGSFYKKVEITLGKDHMIYLGEILGELPRGVTLLNIEWEGQTETIKLIRFP